MAAVLQRSENEKKAGSDRGIDTPTATLHKVKTMQTSDRHSEMAAKIRDGRKAKLANCVKRQRLVEIKQQPCCQRSNE